MSHPYLANTSANPNINRDPPPPPLAGPSGPAPAPPPPPAQHQTIIETTHQTAPIYSPPVPIGIAGPAAAAFPTPIGLGLGTFPALPVPAPIPPLLTSMDPAIFGLAHGGPQGPLAPIRTGNFLPGAHHGIGYGLHAASGVAFPPPPPGAIAGGMPAFAPAGGLAFGNVPAGVGGMGMMGMGMGLGVGMGLGFGAASSMHNRPAPMVHDGNLGFPAQPPQQDVTQIAGGIPPGVTLIEPSEHTIVLNVKGNVCPWLSPGASFVMEPLAFSSSTGLNRLIEVCNGGVPEEEMANCAITECIELGNGMWEKGQTFKYKDAVSTVLTMKDAGWDNKRNRVGGQSLHIWGHRI